MLVPVAYSLPSPGFFNIPIPYLSLRPCSARSLGWSAHSRCCDIFQRKLSGSTMDRCHHLLDDRVGELRIVNVAVEFGYRHGSRQGLLQRFREHRAQRRIVQMTLRAIVVREALQWHEE